ncbi:MAG: SRPBCC domain-containing protein [Solirubrobacterales bacterium]
MSTLAHTVERSVLVAASAHEVWDALTDASLLSEWLADEVQLEPWEGGEVVCHYEDGEERRGEVTLVEEAERLAFEWRREGEPPSRVDLTVDAVGTATRVTVVESGAWPASSPTPALLAAAWGTRLRALPLSLGRLVPA